MKKVAAWIFLVAILVLFQVVGDVPNAFAQSKPRNGWEQSFKAGKGAGKLGLIGFELGLFSGTAKMSFLS